MAWKLVAPVDLQNTIKNYSEAVNVPHVGCSENYMLPSWQFNITYEHDGDSGE